ncbi:LAFA_0G21286g1_1 [Lachancea sp. 'fantastica']|nr:LAFA_0G21286g1_1 [Lachancea sp. 'fantastica']
MANSIPVMTKPGQTVHVGLDGLAIPSTSVRHQTALNNANSAGARRNLTRGGPSLIDILGAAESSPHVSSSTSSHPTVGSHATPLNNERSSGTADTHHGSIAAHSGNNVTSQSPAHFSVLPHVPSGPDLASGATNSTNSSVQICQRMDEVSARMIAMEEMVTKLCCKITDQDASIQQMREQNDRFLNVILSEIRQINHSMPVLDNPDDNEKDGFVTDLLNSITNVSSNYLKRVNSKQTQRYKRQRSSLSEPENHPSKQSVSSPPSAQASLHDNDNNNDNDKAINIAAMARQRSQTTERQALSVSQNANTTNSSALALPTYLTQQSFTLNPNGIKRRRANTVANNNTPTVIQGHQDLAASSNGLGSTSLPNIALENMSRKFGPHMNTNLFPSMQDATIANSRARSRPIDIQVGSDSALDTDSSDEEDGYQEEDEDHNSDAFGSQVDIRATSGRGAVGRPQELNYESAYADFFEPSAQNMSRSTSSRYQRETGANQPNARPPRRTNSKGHERDLNYTLLKAPANVRAIWQEYIEGVNGNPSVKFLEDAYGNKWRLKKNVKTFARRKRLYKFILNGLKRGHSADEMIDLLEKRRIYKNEHGEVKKRTIGWLQQSLSGI